MLIVPERARVDVRGGVYTCENSQKKINKKMRGSQGHAHASAFFGVAFLGVFFFGVAFFAAVFLVAVAFLAAGFLGAAALGAVVLVTLPDLVLPNTRETSCSTAGAEVAVFLGLPALALGLAAAAVFLVVAGFAAFFAAGFLAVVALAFYRGLATTR